MRWNDSLTGPGAAAHTLMMAVASCNVSVAP